MEALIVIGGLGVFAYNVLYGGGEPKPEKGGVSPDTSLPPPFVLWSEPRLWTSSPVDITYRPYQSYFGPNNDPRRAYELYGGVRVPHSGYDPVEQTNQVWTSSMAPRPSALPSYAANPVYGIGKKQNATSQSVFNQ